jgi:hypothetical protein
MRNKGICSIEDCEKPAYTRTWCVKHYYRWKNHGDPLWTPLPGFGRIPGRTDPMPRFWAHVTKTDTCWDWTGGYYSGGYGALHVDGVLIHAHVFAYQQFVGPIPDGMRVDHNCHDPALCPTCAACPHRRCVNPEHLFLAASVPRGIRGLRLGAFGSDWQHKTA